MTNHNYIATNLDRLNTKMDKILLVLEVLKDAMLERKAQKEEKIS